MKRPSFPADQASVGSASQVLAAALIVFAASAHAHEWHRETIPQPGAEREALREHLLQEWRQGHEPPKRTLPVRLASQVTGISALRLALSAAVGAGHPNAPSQAGAFQKFPKLQLRWDNDFLYVESNGMPDHNMMVGITN